IDGRAVSFGWKEGLGARALQRLELDAKKLAFGKESGLGALPAAPGHGPQRPPERRSLLDTVLQPAPAPAWESAAASMYLHYFDDLVPLEQRQAVAAF